MSKSSLLLNYFLISILLLGIFTPTNFLANGGPVDVSHLKNTGQIKLITKEKVTIDEEFLFISLEGDYANVVVKYKLTNHGQTEDIAYAFPVITDRYDDAVLLSFLTMDEYIPFFKMELDGNNLLYKTSGDSAKSDPKSEYYDLNINWNTSTIHLPKNVQKQLVISYRVKNSFYDFGTSKSYFVDWDERKFIYDFSPAKYWGEGIIGKIEIVVNTLGVTYNSETIKIHVNS
jgi:hypothetical protein